MVHRKDGRWQQAVTIDGAVKYFYGKTKAEVLKKINEHKEKRERGRLFEEVADGWWSEHEPTLAHNSIRNYLPAKNRAVASFTGTPIRVITPDQVSREINKFAKTHAAKTAATQLLVYNLIFKYAVENGDAPYNVARDLTVPSGLPKSKRKMPSNDDIARVKTSTGCTFGMFAFWALYTGMRMGELLALDWSDVDIKNRTISITKSLYHVGNRPEVKEPKTEASTAVIPILDALLEKIHPGKGHVFPDVDGGYMRMSRFQSQWEKYCKESGATATPHQFRHAFATMLYEAGIPPEEMQILLRYAQLSTTMNVYTEIREEKQKKVFSKAYSVDFVSSTDSTA